MTPKLPHLAALLILSLAACSEAEPEAEPTSTPAVVESVPQAHILSPAAGEEVAGPDVTVRLDATGIEIVPAGDMTAGTGHHHIYLDTDLHEPGLAVPSVPGAVIHLGDGSAEYTFTDVAPGPHRLIAVVADGIHVPIQPWVVDTVTFTVR